MTIYRNICLVCVLLISLTFSGCKGRKLPSINLFPVSDDIALGKQVAAEIESKGQEYPLLPERGNEEIYSYIRGITSKLLNTGKVKYKDDFAWQVKIINDPNTLNAFATPGGYIYVYTGLIKFLDSEDELAGVMGHEIAHAALRHSTRQMTKLYGVKVVAKAALGDQTAISQVAQGLLSLKFGRKHETEADEYSVIYLCETGYNAAGAAGFFKKMEGQSGTPQFMSTHPNPGNRVKKIEDQAGELSCNGSKTNKSEYDRIKSLLK